MNKDEALALLDQELAKYRPRSYEDLQYLLKTQDAYEVIGPTGISYQIEIQAVWDDRPGGNLRVMGGIDDGGIRAFMPLTRDFIVSPTGEFIGE